MLKKLGQAIKDGGANTGIGIVTMLGFEDTIKCLKVSPAIRAQRAALHSALASVTSFTCVLWPSLDAPAHLDSKGSGSPGGSAMCEPHADASPLRVWCAVQPGVAGRHRLDAVPRGRRHLARDAGPGWRPPLMGGRRAVGAPHRLEVRSYHKECTTLNVFPCQGGGLRNRNQRVRLSNII